MFIDLLKIVFSNDSDVMEAIKAWEIDNAFASLPVPTNGIDGNNGVDGVNGENGKDGLNGRDGQDGKDAILDMELLQSMIKSMMPKLPKVMKKQEVLDLLEEFGKEHNAKLKKLENTVLLNYGGHGGSGGGTSVRSIFNEVVSGSGTTFTLAHTPTANTQVLFGIGQYLTPTVDYTIAGAVVTTLSPWNAGEIIANYQY